MRSSLRFKKFVELERLKQKLAEAAEGSDFPDRVIAYLSAAFGNGDWERQFWKTPASSMVDGFKKFVPDKSIPILSSSSSKKDDDWEYEGRSWNYLSHILAKAYGWTLEYIADLGVNEAFGHIQEILTDDHLEHEFFYSLSEIAYPYNKSSKKSEFKPMPRPYWMKPVAPKAPKKFKMKRSLLPVGRVVDVSGLPPEFAIEGYETEKIDPKRNSQPVSSA